MARSKRAVIQEKGVGERCERERGSEPLYFVRKGAMAALGWASELTHD